MGQSGCVTTKVTRGRSQVTRIGENFLVNWNSDFMGSADTVRKSGNYHLYIVTIKLCYVQ